MESEKIVHLVDLGGADATQWLELLHLLAVRPEGPLHLRLTAVHEHRDVLTQTAMVLSKEAERLDVPIQFNPVVSRLEALDVESLRVKTDEALAITSSLQLHCLLAIDDDRCDDSSKGTEKEKKRQRSPESGVSPSTSRADALWGLSPKVVVVTCEGAERRERLDRWAARMEGAGFARVPLSYYALLQARRAVRRRPSQGRAVRRRRWRTSAWYAPAAAQHARTEAAAEEEEVDARKEAPATHSATSSAVVA